MKQSVISITVIVGLLIIGNLWACDNNGTASPLKTGGPNPTITSPASPKPLVISIGNLTDVTGPSASAQSVINMSLQDMVDYYNSESIIPGIEFNIIDYDTRMEESRYLVGYEWLKLNGADFIVTGVPGVAEKLHTRVDADKTILITYPSSKEGLLPPGYVFCPGSAFNDDLGYTAMKWVAENDKDFPYDRPAKVGGTAWDEPYMRAFLRGAEQYCVEHTEKFDWQGKYLADFNFSWDTQAEALRDCDYIIPPQIMHSFAKTYLDAGYSAKYISIDAQIAFVNLIDKENLWNAVDGMLFFKTMPCWTDKEENISFVKQLLTEYHPDQAEQIMKSGSGYLCVLPNTMIFEMISNLVEDGLFNEQFDTQVVYQALQALSFEIAGTTHNFSEIKRTSANDIRVYEMKAEEKDIFSVDSNWYPLSVLP